MHTYPLFKWDPSSDWVNIEWKVRSNSYKTMFKGKKNTSIRLKLQRMRKKSVRKKIQNGGSSSISTSDQQQPANKSHHISYLSTDEIRNLQVNFYILYTPGWHQYNLKQLSHHEGHIFEAKLFLYALSKNFIQNFVCLWTYSPKCKLISWKKI